MSDFEDDFNWDDDPFGGDVDFDMDFDNPKGKKGFIRSFVSGFLGGLVDGTVGTTDGRIKTLKTILPKNSVNTFRALRELNDQKEVLIRDLKHESKDLVEDLQYLAGRAAKASYSEEGSNRISSNLLKFSEHDFSDWDKDGSPTTSNQIKMEGVEDHELNSLLEQNAANSEMQQATAREIGAQTVSSVTEVGGRTIAGIHQLNSGMLRGNQLLEQLLTHQRQVKAKHDTLQLNILTRTYLTNVKFYKFVEASNHKVIEELTKIGKHTLMSDYEKTTTTAAIKKHLRERFFTSATNKASGAMGFFEDKLMGVSQGISGMGDMTGSVRMMMEMSEGMPVDVGNMAGGMAAQLFISSIPKLIKSKKGRETLAKFEKSYPSFAEQVRKAYKDAEDILNVTGYVGENYEQMLNSLVSADSTLGSGSFGEATGIDRFETYNDYKESVPSGQRTLSRVEFEALKKLVGGVGKGLTSIVDGSFIGNTRVSLKGRTTADGHEAEIWTRRSDRTLNEIIPRWFSEIHLSLEKMRTGNERLQAITYDYKTAGFVSKASGQQRVLREVFDKNSVGYQARMAKTLVDEIDTNNSLSPKAKNALALELAKQADRGMGFNPYNFLFLEKSGVPAGISSEIKRVMQSQFDITEEDVTRFMEGDVTTRASMLAYQGTTQSRAKMVSLGERGKDLGRTTPEYSRNIDELKASGYYPHLVEAGLIKVDERGNEHFNNDMIWDVLQRQIEDENFDVGSLARKSDEGTSRRQRNNRQLTPTTTTTTTATTASESSDEISEAISSLTPALSTFNQSVGQLTNLADLVPSVGKLGDKVDLTNSTLKDILGFTETSVGIFEKLLKEGIPTSGVKGVKSDEEVTEEKQKEEAKKGLIDRLKETDLKGMFNSGVEKVLSAEPLILGGLLGGLAGTAFFNPKAATILGAGLAAGALYGKVKTYSGVKKALDSEDIYVEGEEEPVLLASKLKSGDYYDLVSGALIKSWDDIKGAVKDIYDNTVIGVKTLSQKLFTAQNKEIILTGLSKVRKMASDAFKAMDPFGRMKSVAEAAKNRFFQQDVYRAGDSEPTLLGVNFKRNLYFSKDENGEFKVIKGWNEITGAVYDEEGNQLITQSDFEAGLTTTMGVNISKMTSAVSRAKDIGLELLGKAKARTLKTAGKVKDKVTDAMDFEYTPIVNSVDRIYNWLVWKWGGPTGDTTLGEVDKPVSEDGVEVSDEVNKSFGLSPLAKLSPQAAERLNSIEDQIRQEREEETTRTQRAIQEISKNLRPPTEDEEKKGEEPGGLFGMLKGMFGRVTGLLGGMFSFFTGPMLSIFGGLGKGVGFLLDFLTKGMFSKTLGGFRGVSRFMGTSGLAAFGVGAGVNYARNFLKDMGIIQEGGVADKALDYTSTAANVVGGAQLAYTTLKFVAPATTAALTAKAATIGAATKGAIVTGGAFAKGALITGAKATGSFLVGATGLTLMAGVGAILGVYAFHNRGEGKKTILRMAQYGLADHKTDLAGKIAFLEDALEPYLEDTPTGYKFKENLPVGDILNLFEVNTSHSTGGITEGDFIGWFNSRFRPVFLTHRASFKKYGGSKITFKEYDDTSMFRGAKEFDDGAVYAKERDAHNSLKHINPHPYGIIAKIDTKQALMSYDQTNAMVEKLLEEVKEFSQRRTSDGVMGADGARSRRLDAEFIGVDSDVVRTELSKRREALEKEATWWDSRFNPLSSRGRQLNDIWHQERILGDPEDIAQAKAEKEARQMIIEENKKKVEFASTLFESSNNIDDLVTDGETIDVLTEIRVLAYGAEPDNSKGVVAALTLERYCEGLVKSQAGEYDLEVDPIIINGMFKEHFEGSLNSPYLEEKNFWPWFNTRFKPVFLTWVKGVKEATGNLPKQSWRSLKKKERLTIAKAIINLEVIVKGFLWDSNKPIWAMGESPFFYRKHYTGNDGSPRSTMALIELVKSDAKARKLLETLEQSSDINIKTNDRLTNMANNKDKRLDDLVQRAVKREREADSQLNIPWAPTPGAKGQQGLGSRVVGTGKDGEVTWKDYAGQYTNPVMGAVREITGSTDMSDVDMSGIKVKSGNDRGISMPAEVAEQAIIKEMIKQGFTDPRQIALLLANTKHETGNYSSTVENMNYRDPARLKSLFREVRTVEQAKRLVEAGPETIAGVVYGTGSKGRELGNESPEDGWNYRGRGLIQLTGKSNFKRLSNETGVDYVSKPRKLSEDPEAMAVAAVNFFKHSKQMQSISQGASPAHASAGINPSGLLPGEAERVRNYHDYLGRLTRGELKVKESTKAELDTEVASSDQGVVKDPTGKEKVLITPNAVINASTGGGKQPVDSSTVDNNLTGGNDTVPTPSAITSSTSSPALSPSQRKLKKARAQAAKMKAKAMEQGTFNTGRSNSVNSREDLTPLTPNSRLNTNIEDPSNKGKSNLDIASAEFRQSGLTREPQIEVINPKDIENAVMQGTKSGAEEEKILLTGILNQLKRMADNSEAKPKTVDLY